MSADAGQNDTSPPGDTEVDSTTVLKPGLRVRLSNLVAKPELNGKWGKLEAFDEEKGRWQVALEGTSETKLFKAANLEPEKPPKPRRPLPTEPLSAEETVEWINSAVDEFEALLLPLRFEEDAGKIRKQYKQLSLLVHPDKNKHPQAEEAFKKLFGAFEKLAEPMDQRVALRRAKGRAEGRTVGLDEAIGERWWEQATVDEMEKSFREMESKLEKMGIFAHEKKLVQNEIGIDEDALWITPEAAKDLLEKDLAIFLDSRNTSDYDVSHVRGAHSLPGHTMEQLARIEFTPSFRLIVENPEQTVIVYSDNGSKMSRCVHVARALREHWKLDARNVLRLTGGLNLWKRNGFVVDGDQRVFFAGQVLGNSMMRLS